MNSKYQSIILTLLTLAIGFVAGFMFNSVLFQNKIEKFREDMGRRDGYIHHICKIVEASPEQCEQIQPILASHHPKMRELNRKFGQDMRASLDSLSKQLTPILTPEQIDKLKRPMRRRKKRWDKSTSPQIPDKR